MSVEQFINGGAVVVLVALLGIIVRWLIKRLERCESKAEELADRLEWREHER